MDRTVDIKLVDGYGTSYQISKLEEQLQLEREERKCISLTVTCIILVGLLMTALGHSSKICKLEISGMIISGIAALSPLFEWMAKK